MREFKFRAWNTRPNMVTGLTRGDLGMIYFSIDELDCGYIVHSRSYLDDDTEVMRFTGMLDRHGKEIYEGDLIYLMHEGKPLGKKDKDGKHIPVAREVKWLDEQAGFNISKRTASWCEVVGNIYEGVDNLNK